MSRNGLFALLGVLAVIVVALGAYTVYQQQTRPGLEIKIDDNGLKVTGQ